MIVLDTDVLIEIERGNQKVISFLVNLRKTHPENIAITSSVYAELLYGFLARNKQLPKELASFDVIEFDKESAEIFAQNKKSLDGKGTPIPIFDLVTASCVIAKKALLISFDRHFEKVNDLNFLLIQNNFLKENFSPSFFNKFS